MNWYLTYCVTDIFVNHIVDQICEIHLLMWYAVPSSGHPSLMPNGTKAEGLFRLQECIALW